MPFEVIAVGAFALLTIARVAWEIATRKPKRDRADDAEWSNAIR